MNSTTRTQIRRRTVEVTWVPGHDIYGRPIMEMRWHVGDGPAVVRVAH